MPFPSSFVEGVSAVVFVLRNLVFIPLKEVISICVPNVMLSLKRKMSRPFPLTDHSGFYLLCFNATFTSVTGFLFTLLPHYPNGFWYNLPFIPSYFWKRSAYSPENYPLLLLPLVNLIHYIGVLKVNIYFFVLFFHSWFPLFFWVPKNKCHLIWYFSFSWLYVPLNHTFSHQYTQENLKCLSPFVVSKYFFILLNDALYFVTCLKVCPVAWLICCISLLIIYTSFKTYPPELLTEALYHLEAIKVFFQAIFQCSSNLTWTIWQSSACTYFTPLNSFLSVTGISWEFS